MIRLAICDDEKQDLDALASAVEDYALERKTDISYETFTNYLDLEPRIGEFDIFFIDYAMPQMDGMTFARIIRSAYNGSKTLIFVTKNDWIVYDAFTVQAHRFLRKPLSKEKLFEALDAFFQNGQAAKALIVRSRQSISVVNISDILFVEAFGKKTLICTEKEQIVCRRTIASLESELRPHGFFRVHRSYLVNMKKVWHINQRELELTDGRRIAVSSRKYHAFSREYLRSQG